MENSDFKIDIRLVWILVIGNIILTIVGAFAKTQQWEFSQLLFTGALILFFSIWIIVIIVIEYWVVIAPPQTGHACHSLTGYTCYKTGRMCWVLHRREAPSP